MSPFTSKSHVQGNLIWSLGFLCIKSLCFGCPRVQGRSRGRGPPSPKNLVNTYFTIFKVWNSNNVIILLDFDYPVCWKMGQHRSEQLLERFKRLSFTDLPQTVGLKVISNCRKLISVVSDGWKCYFRNLKFKISWGSMPPRPPKRSSCPPPPLQKKTFGVYCYFYHVTVSCEGPLNYWLLVRMNIFFYLGQGSVF